MRADEAAAAGHKHATAGPEVSPGRSVL
jgi:hypothetical protein